MRLQVHRQISIGEKERDEDAWGLSIFEREKGGYDKLVVSTWDRKKYLAS